ncbi:V-ATPase subunit H [Gracilaria domingensis]|nr:V-ATPase subunit H [Gracilaria domingensis]
MACARARPPPPPPPPPPQSSRPPPRLLRPHVRQHRVRARLPLAHGVGALPVQYQPDGRVRRAAGRARRVRARLPRRTAPHTARLLSDRIGHIVHALVCTAGAVNSRVQMLRAVTLLTRVLAGADFALLRQAVRGCAAALVERQRRQPAPPPHASPHSHSNSVGPPFLRALANIAVNRVSDKQLSALAADSLAFLLGCAALDHGADKSIPPHICDQADEQTTRLIAMLITELVLTSSPPALSALAKLLRRDAARYIFCKKDGVSTLASILRTTPGHSFTAIGEQIAHAQTNADPVEASYHAVFAVWMLTFAKHSNVVHMFLKSVVSSRLVVVLAKLLNHSSGQRLKIARVTLASLRNMATGATDLHREVRRDLVCTDIPHTLQRIMHMTSGAGSLIGKDDDAMADAHALHELLLKEKASMSSLQAYISELKFGALHWSPLHTDSLFWEKNAAKLVQSHREVLTLLSDTISSGKASDEERLIACHDLVCLIQYSPTGRHAIASIPGLKACLMKLMTSAPNPQLRHKALNCVQLILLSGRIATNYVQ